MSTTIKKQIEAPQGKRIDKLDFSCRVEISEKENSSNRHYLIIGAVLAFFSSMIFLSMQHDNLFLKEIIVSSSIVLLLTINKEIGEKSEG